MQAICVSFRSIFTWSRRRLRHNAMGVDLDVQHQSLGPLEKGFFFCIVGITDHSTIAL